MKFLILENIRSAYNVGAIFRTADATGVNKVFLIGYTPSPIDRFGRPQKEISKTSLGASEEITWEHFKKSSDIIPKLKEEGVKIVAVEQINKAIPLSEFKVPGKVAYILGNEIEGLKDETLSLADYVIEIPMLGQKESLNVSVVGGVVLYHGLV